MVLIPLFLFALLHAQNYTKQLLNVSNFPRLPDFQLNMLRSIAKVGSPIKNKLFNIIVYNGKNVVVVQRSKSQNNFVD